MSPLGRNVPRRAVVDVRPTLRRLAHGDCLEHGARVETTPTDEAGWKERSAELKSEDHGQLIGDVGRDGRSDEVRPAGAQMRYDR